MRLLQNNERGFPLIFTITVVELWFWAISAKIEDPVSVTGVILTLFSLFLLILLLIFL
jgi:hypothetical protein